MPIRRLIIPALALVLLAGACARDDRTVLATVNGEDITLDQFNDASASRAATQGLSLTTRLDGPDSASLMTNLIAFSTIRGPLADLGIDLPPLVGGGDPAELQIVRGALQSLGSELVGGATAEGQQAAIDELLSDVNAVDRPSCLSHILTPELEIAELILERLANGEAFGDLAAELSIDPASGAAEGSLGCRPPSEYVPEFEAAAALLDVGDVTAPVETSFGFHIIVRTPDTADIGAGVLTEARDAAVNDWIGERFAEAVVDLDPAIGTWTGEGIESASANPGTP